MPTNLILQIQPFAIALVLGILIGVEREASHPIGFQPLGMRTFILLSLLGTVAALINQPLVALAITFFVGSVVIAGYMRSSVVKTKFPDIGITTEVAAVVTFGLGYLAFSEPFIALVIGVVVLATLIARTRLHEFSRSQLRPKELQATTILLVLGIGIIPFLPNLTIDPWRLINPQRFGLLLLSIAVLQFGAYIGIRLLGSERGILLSGFLAGLVSSTAATATLSQEANRPEASIMTIASAVILSTIATLLKLYIIIYILSPRLTGTLLFTLPIVTSTFIMAIVVFIATRSNNQEHSYPPPENPLSIRSAIKYALILGSLFIIVSIVQRYYGDEGTRIVSLLGGLVDVHGVAIALAALFHNGHISATEATNNITFAVLTSFISKYALVWSIAGGRYAMITTAMLTLMIFIYALTWLTVLFF